jgi:cytochrome b
MGSIMNGTLRRSSLIESRQALMTALTDISLMMSGGVMEHKTINKSAGATGPDNFIRVWHLAMVVLCLGAWLTGDLADDYEKLAHAGFIIHGWLGVALAGTVCLYLGYGLMGPRHSRFSQWFPFTRARLHRAGSELAGLVRFKLPEHRRHQGLAGLVQFFGILIFIWLAATGSLLYFFIEPGSKARGFLHAVKEAHEVGEVLIPLYLSVHIGAVIVQSLAGRLVWQEMFFFKKADY